MTVPPLPESPVVRVRLDFTNTDTSKAGCRFFIGYSGSAPTAANLDTLASDVASSFATRLGAGIPTDWALTEVDILDIATQYGAFGSWSGSNAGSEAGTPLPSQTALNIEYSITRRYRGGKPRIFLPAGVEAQQADAGHWDSTWAASMATAFGNFMGDIAALSIGSMGTLRHVNVSYYEGFTNVTNSSGRTRAAPKYRSPTALVDNVTGYVAKTVIGSQRKRRTSTTY